MNQEAFRQLLTTPHSASSSSLTAAAVGSSSTKKAVLNPSQPAFQPRKVKKKASDSQYRDRASERRAGVNEYAKVESVLEDFEQRTAENEDREAVEEQRRFLGGDKDHTILVKGLDYALLEQNKARVAASHEDDDSLEVAFQEARTVPTVPKKRTREDIVRDLKEKRATEGTVTTTPQLADDSLESAKKVGKFKPIGLPDESKVTQKSRKVKGKEKETSGEGERKRKRRKVAQGSTDASTKPSGVPNELQHSLILPPGPNLPTTIECAPNQPTYDATETLGQEGIESGMGADADVDIFEDAGEYEGVDLGEDDDDEQLDMPVVPVPPTEIPLSGSPEVDGQGPMGSWFKEDPDTKALPSPTITPPTPPPTESMLADTALEPEQPARLAPLASSALPSISDFLAMDAHAEARKKKMMKKEKKKGEKGKVSTEVKVDRDYKKLNSYMTKKGSVKE